MSVIIGKDGLCECSCAEPCPLRRTGTERRCRAAELVAAGIPIVSPLFFNRAELDKFLIQLESPKTLVTGTECRKLILDLRMALRALEAWQAVEKYRLQVRYTSHEYGWQAQAGEVNWQMVMHQLSPIDAVLSLRDNLEHDYPAWSLGECLCHYECLGKDKLRPGFGCKMDKPRASIKGDPGYQWDYINKACVVCGRDATGNASADGEEFFFCSCTTIANAAIAARKKRIERDGGE